MYTTRQAPYYSLPSCHVVITVSIFATPWCWRLLTSTGAIATALPNPSTKTSSRGFRQGCLCLVWADSCGGVSNSIVLSLVRSFPFCFRAVPPLHPFHPACVDCQWTPSPSCFPYPLSPLWQCHHCIALALPLLVWRHAIVPLPLPCWDHLCIRTTTTVTAICLSPCHCHQRTSLALDAYSLAVLANVDANTLIGSPQLWWRWRRGQRQRHRHMFFCRPHRPTPLLQSKTGAQHHLPMPLHCCHLPMPFPSMLIVVCCYFSLKRKDALDSALWLWI